MARTDTLGNFLTDVAEAIREKEGTTETISASEFDTRISNLSGGGSEDLTEELETYNNELTAQETTIDNLIETLKNKGIGEAPKYAPKYICFNSYDGTDLTEELINLDTSNITNMTNMFYQCDHLTSLDVSNFNTSKVTRMTSMFFYCEKVTSLNVNSFDTSNVTHMTQMFYRCRTLTSLNLSSFNTSKVTLMSSMFRGSGVVSLDLSNFNTSQVTDMSNMFRECKALTKLDIRNFVFDKVTSYSNMFTQVPVDCEIIVKDETAKAWVLDKRSDLTNIKTVAEL